MISVQLLYKVEESKLDAGLINVAVYSIQKALQDQHLWYLQRRAEEAPSDRGKSGAEAVAGARFGSGVCPRG